MAPHPERVVWGEQQAQNRHTICLQEAKVALDTSHITPPKPSPHLNYGLYIIIGAAGLKVGTDSKLSADSRHNGRGVM